MNATPRSTLRTGLAFAAAAALAALAAPGCTGGGGNEARPASLRDPQAALAALLDRGHPAAAAAEGFVGSERCIGCHGGVYESYAKTPHALGFRTAGRAGTTGLAVAAEDPKHGLDEFSDRRDLALSAPFAALGAAAPKLSFEKGAERPYRAAINGVTYEVESVYGGKNREDYLVRLGRSLYRLPLEFDVANRSWDAVDLDTWYLGTAPRFATLAAAAGGVDRSASAERRCLGCHTSGFSVTFDGGTGEWLAGYNELGTGCESCHGPGLDHVLSEGNKDLILNPRRWADGSAAGARRADDTCARCHTRGTGALLAGSPDPVLYAWSNAFGPFVPGEDARDFIAASTDPADYFGTQDNYLGLVPTPADPTDDSWIASRAGWNQATEQYAGVHAPKDGPPPGVANPTLSGRCFDCHAVHGSAQPSQIREDSPLVPGARLSSKDGSLCLSCHASRTGDPFEALAKDDVLDFTKGREAKVRGAVIDHMKQAGMALDEEEDFRPAKTGVGRCTTCHMVSTNSDPRGGTVDADGLPAGGPGGGNHGGLVIWPSASARHGFTNSCNSCHPDDATDPAEAILDQWLADPDGDGRLHGFYPRNDFLGLLNASSGDGLRCARCHTTPGFRGIVVQGDPGLASDEARLAAIVRRSVRMDAGITCAACHGAQADGTFLPGKPPLRLPKKDLCASCHFGAGITFEDYSLRGSAVHFPQADLMAGTAGSEPPLSGPYLNASHMFFQDGCVKCHFDTGTAGATPTHTFQPQVQTCQECHPGAVSFDIKALGDYDGDGLVEGLQSEVAGLLVVLKGALLVTGDPLITFDIPSQSFRRSGQPGLPGAPVAAQRAAYNWETINQDGSRGIHNIPRAIKLLQQSYKELKLGVNVPGAVMW